MTLVLVVREKNTNNVAGSSINKGLAENLESLKNEFCHPIIKNVDKNL